MTGSYVVTSSLLAKKEAFVQGFKETSNASDQRVPTATAITFIGCAVQGLDAKLMGKKQDAEGQVEMCTIYWD